MGWLWMTMICSVIVSSLLCPFFVVSFREITRGYHKISTSSWISCSLIKGKQTMKPSNYHHIILPRNLWNCWLCNEHCIKYRQCFEGKNIYIYMAQRLVFPPSPPPRWWWSLYVYVSYMCICVYIYIISNFSLLTCGPYGPWRELWKGLWKKPGQ